MPQTEADNLNAINTDELLDFFQDNPDIFLQQPQLLEALNLADDRATASLIERQTQVLKERIKQHHAQQRDLLEVARQNEQINDSFVQIICQLMSFKELSHFTEHLPKAIAEIFSIDQVSFKIAEQVEAENKPAFEEAMRRCVNNRTVCDNRLPSSIVNLFFTQGIQSVALIPLSNQNCKQPLGILALGSIDKHRYTTDLGTTHLDRLGVMAGTCLARLLS